MRVFEILPELTRRREEGRRKGGKVSAELYTTQNLVQELRCVHFLWVSCSGDPKIVRQVEERARWPISYSPLPSQLLFFPPARPRFDWVKSRSLSLSEEKDGLAVVGALSLSEPFCPDFCPETGVQFV